MNLVETKKWAQAATDSALMQEICGSDCYLPSLPLLDLFGMNTFPATELRETREVPIATSKKLQASLELVRRAMSEVAYAGKNFSSPGAIKDWLRVELRGKEQEEFWVLFLDGMNRLISHEIMFTGTLSEVTVHPREVVRKAMQLNAASVVLVHNHPLQSAKASGADIKLTNHMKEALWLVNVSLTDHMIVGGPKVLSMAEEGLL